MTPRPDHVTVEVYQHDWIPGFAAFADDGAVQAGAPAHVVLNLGSILCAVEKGDLARADVPYMIAESLMHETMHALEAWANVEFDEARIESLLEKYRTAVGQPTLWLADSVVAEKLHSEELNPAPIHDFLESL